MTSLTSKVRSISLLSALAFTTPCLAACRAEEAKSPSLAVRVGLTPTKITPELSVGLRKVVEAWSKPSTHITRRDSTVAPSSSDSLANSREPAHNFSSLTLPTQVAKDPEIEKLRQLIKDRNKVIDEQRKAMEELAKKQMELTKQLSETDKNLNEKLEGIAKELEEAQKSLSAANEHLAQLNNEKSALDQRLKELERKAKELSKTISLTISPKLLDVYIDGSPFRDCWTVKMEVNGKVYTLWDKKSVSDNQTTENGPGPGGDKDCTRYTLENSDIKVNVNPGDEVKISVYGIAHDDNHPVGRSSFILNKANAWGTKGTNIPGSKPARKHTYKGLRLIRIGAADEHQDTEYYIFINVKINKDSGK